MLKVEDKFQRTRIAKNQGRKGELKALCPGASARPPTYRIPLFKENHFNSPLCAVVESPLLCELHNPTKTSPHKRNNPIPSFHEETALSDLDYVLERNDQRLPRAIYTPILCREPHHRPMDTDRGTTCYIPPPLRSSKHQVLYYVLG